MQEKATAVAAVPTGAAADNAGAGVGCQRREHMICLLTQGHLAIQFLALKVYANMPQHGLLFQKFFSLQEYNHHYE